MQKYVEISSFKSTFLQYDLISTANRVCEYPLEIDSSFVGIGSHTSYLFDCVCICKYVYAVCMCVCKHANASSSSVIGCVCRVSIPRTNVVHTQTHFFCWGAHVGVEIEGMNRDGPTCQQANRPHHPQNQNPSRKKSNRQISSKLGYANARRSRRRRTRHACQIVSIDTHTHSTYNTNSTSITVYLSRHHTRRHSPLHPRSVRARYKNRTRAQ